MRKWCEARNILTPAILVVALGLGSAAVLSGCNFMAFTAFAIGGEPEVEKKFQLADLPTIVVVDDPNNLLGSQALTAVVATTTDYYLRKNDAFGLLAKWEEQKPMFGDPPPKPEPPLLDQQLLYQVQTELGQKYEETSIARIGELAGAKQVVYVLITGVVYESAPGVYQPKATSEVKVLNLEKHERVFPPQQPFESALTQGGPAPGYQMSTELDVDISSTLSGRQPLTLQQKLARRIGLDVSRLFYDWKPPDPGVEDSE